MIEARVTRTLGNFVLDAEIRDEGFICLSGANGSGKSTFLNIIAGVMVPDRGHVLVNSKDVTRLPIEKRETVLVTPDSSIPHLDAGAHILWGAKIRGIKIHQSYVEEVRSVLGVPTAGRVQELSLGMRERLSLATALISRPKAILVDEAFSNLDNRDEFMTNYRRLSSEAKIEVVFATQSLEPDEKHVAHVYRMVTGRSSRIR